jgi:hypothetical protein
MVRKGVVRKVILLGKKEVFGSVGSVVRFEQL